MELCCPGLEGSLGVIAQEIPERSVGAKIPQKMINIKALVKTRVS
jgi:hypothetical protein